MKAGSRGSGWRIASECQCMVVGSLSGLRYTEEATQSGCRPPPGAEPRPMSFLLAGTDSPAALIRFLLTSSPFGGGFVVVVGNSRNASTANRKRERIKLSRSVSNVELGCSGEKRILNNDSAQRRQGFTCECYTEPTVVRHRLFPDGDGAARTVFTHHANRPIIVSEVV